MKRFSLIKIASLTGLTLWAGSAIAENLNNVLHTALIHPEVKKQRKAKLARSNKQSKQLEQICCLV